jgi:hypothetical protein
MHEIEISYEGAKVILNDGAKRWLIDKIVNHFAFIRSDAPVLVKAILMDKWSPAAHNAWALTVGEWQEKGNIFQVRENIDWVRDYTVSRTST